MSDLLGYLLGPMGAIIAGVVVGIVALITGRQQGKRKAQATRAADDAEAYQNKRGEIDNADLGHDDTDLQRIERLRALAKRRGGSND